MKTIANYKNKIYLLKDLTFNKYYVIDKTVNDDYFKNNFTDLDEAKKMFNGFCFFADALEV